MPTFHHLKIVAIVLLSGIVVGGAGGARAQMGSDPAVVAERLRMERAQKPEPEPEQETAEEPAPAEGLTPEAYHAALANATQLLAEGQLDDAIALLQDLRDQLGEEVKDRAVETLVAKVELERGKPGEALTTIEHVAPELTPDAPYEPEEFDTCEVLAISHLSLADVPEQSPRWKQDEAPADFFGIPVDDLESDETPTAKRERISKEHTLEAAQTFEVLTTIAAPTAAAQGHAEHPLRAAQGAGKAWLKLGEAARAVNCFQFALTYAHGAGDLLFEKADDRDQTLAELRHHLQQAERLAMQ